MELILNISRVTEYGNNIIHEQHRITIQNNVLKTIEKIQTSDKITAITIWDERSLSDKSIDMLQKGMSVSLERLHQSLGETRFEGLSLGKEEEQQKKAYQALKNRLRKKMKEEKPDTTKLKWYTEVIGIALL